MTMTSLTQLRDAIDQLDQELVALVNRRGELARQVGELKAEAGEPVYSQAREEEVISRCIGNNQGPLSDQTVRVILREVISGCRALQLSLRVAYLGPEFSYSHLAAIHRFGQSGQLIPVATIAAAFEEVEEGHAQFALVPMENSTDGRVADTLDRMSRSPLRICGEVPLRIHHCLLGLDPRGEITTVYSKPQALSQCRNWLAKHLPKAQSVEVASTSEAARLASAEPRVAAIASRQAGVNHHLHVLAENIEDNVDNVTRFAVISDTCAPRTGNDKTALMFEIAHRPGALADAMAIFKRHNLNMTWIESFPIPGSRGSYLFFVEFVGHQQDEAAGKAIAELDGLTKRLEVLGSYAKMEPVE
jgi:chorismate mutase/prephenate dehydratase